MPRYVIYGAGLDPKTAVWRVCAYDLGVEQRTYTSTWQDLHLKRGCTEVDFLNGAIERLGSQNGIPTPRNSFLLHTVREMASNEELPGKYSAQELKSILENR